MTTAFFAIALKAKWLILGAVIGALYAECVWFFSSRRHRPADSLAWLNRSTPAAARFDAELGLWTITLSDGSTMSSSNRFLIEQYLDAMENRDRQRHATRRVTRCRYDRRRRGESEVSKCSS